MSERLLESRISELRNQVRRLLVFHGLSWVIAAAIPAMILAGLMDWLFHLDDLVRVALLISLAGVTLFVGYKLVLRPLIISFADLDIALKIERRWPGLNDRLASTIEFLRLNPSDERLGSPALREATVRRAMEETESIDFREAIEPQPVIRAASLAASTVGLALLIGLAAPGSSRIAMRRLFLPWAGERWPQATHLVLDEAGTSLKIARGDSFTVAVRVRKGDRIPESARVTYRFADGEETSEPLRPVEGGEFRGRLETVNQPFRFSVAGGDDLTSIRDIQVKVVPPPALNRLTLRLISPSYTGIPDQTLAPGLTSFRALKGTQIQIEAQANKPLSSAVLHLGEQQSKEELVFDALRTSFRTRCVVQDNLNFSFSLKDTEGFQNRESVQYDVRMFKDEAPRVVISEPKTDRDVPSDATVPVRIELDDDFGLHSSRLNYKISSGESEPHDAVAIPLWSAPDRATSPTQAGFVKHQELSYEWKLAPLKLDVGSIITLYADARDYDTIQGPKMGKSRELRLRIVSKEDATRQFDDARRELREEISRILAMQRQAITPIEEAIRTLKTDQLPRKQRDDLNNSSLIQRQVSSRMSNRDEGLEQKIRRLVDDLRNFKLANPDADQQLQGMLEQINQLREKNLGPAEQGLTQANKSLEQIRESSQNPAGQIEQKESEAKPALKDQAISAAAKASGEQAKDSTSSRSNPSREPDPTGSPSKPSPNSENSKAPRPPEPPKPEPTDSPLETAKRSLAGAENHQKTIADELQKMLEGLGEFETYRGVVKDAQSLLKKQEESMKQVAESAAKPDLAGKSSEALSPEQKAELGNLSDRQSELSRGLQNLQERMDDLAKRLEESDPLAASAMREASANSRKQGTNAKMGEAADNIEKNQMGQAHSRQEAARQELRELVDAVQNRRERELARLVKELKKAEGEMRELRKRQAQNLKATREAKQNPNAQERRNQLRRLAKEQTQIQQELKRQLQRLAKLNAERASQAGNEASGKMGRAQEQLDQDQGEEAGKNEEEALADLNDAQDELEQARKDAEERLAMEQLARMGDQLKSLTERQQKVVTDAESYENLRRQGNGKLTIAQRAGVRGLGQVQGGLKDETSGLAEQLEGAPVFSLTLKRAADSMETAATRLQGLKTDEETLQAVRSAAHRFQQLMESLKADNAKNGAGGGGGGGGGGDGGGGDDSIPATAQLKMLKTLQREINERTESFDELKRRNKKMTAEQTKEIERLATDQGTLADLVRDLTRPKRDDGEE